MSEKDFEDLDELQQEDLEDRGDSFEEDDEDQDEIADDDEGTDDDESDDSDVDLDEEESEEEDIPNTTKVPKSRLDEVIRQREAAKERNLWLEAQLEKLIDLANKPSQSSKEPSKPERIPFDFDAAEEEYVSLIIEGDITKASKLRAKIDAERKEELKELVASITESATSKATTESSAVIEAEKFNTLIESYENKYKFLNTESKEYNEEAVDTINTLLAGYVAAGKSKSEGLKLAVAKVAPLYSKPIETKQSLGNKRKVEAGKKAVEAARSQPTKTRSVSTRQVDKEGISVSKMSEKEFAQLTEKEKRILRGD